MRLVSQLSVRRPLEPGDRVDDHLIIRSVLGKGGTAVVFEALHTRLSSLVALKVVEVDAAYARDAAARLEREALVCAAIDDPHIPKIYDVGQLEDGTPYMVMEKIAGPTLEHMLEEGPLRPRMALSIVRDLLSALSAVHHAGVVHRDIKPSNLIVQTAEDGALRVRLMDFGVSKAMSHRKSDPAITHQGALVGTPHYMAPEQISDEGVDGRTDVYAAGVLLYELLAGHVPFDGGSTAEVMTAVLRHSHTPLATLAPRTSPALAALVERAMAERPDDRFASARDMRDALDGVIAALDAPSKARHASSALLPSRNMLAWSALSVGFAFVLAVGSRHAVGNSDHAPGSTTGSTERARPMPMTGQTAHTANVHLASPQAHQAQPSQVVAARTSEKAARPLVLPRKPVHPVTRPAAVSTQARVAPVAPVAPIAAGVLVSDYVRQLEELGRVVSDVAADLEQQGPLPANPYQ